VAVLAWGHGLAVGQPAAAPVAARAAPGLFQVPAPEPEKPPDVQRIKPAPEQPGAPEAPPAEPLGPERFRLPYLRCEPGPSGSLPAPTREVQEEFGRFVAGRVDPTNTLDLTLNRPTVLLFKQAVKRVQTPDERTLTALEITPRELSLTGKAVGTTVLTLWFADPRDPKKETILSYLVRVRPVPGSRQDPRERLERIYKALECEINRAFPDSVIHLTLVGDRVVLSGQAKDRPDADAILRLVQGNALG
jgi:pilus assembly protein CpaC